MAQANVNTDTLRQEGKYAKDECELIENSFNTISSIDTGNVQSLQSFKNALRNKIQIFEYRIDILNKLINKCAMDLEFHEKLQHYYELMRWCKDNEYNLRPLGAANLYTKTSEITECLMQLKLAIIE